MHRLLESSDPFISSLRDAQSKREMDFCKDAMYMLDQESTDQDEEGNDSVSELKYSVSD